MRGFGAVQTCFGSEAQMDLLAAELGIDPVELRLRNALAPGDVLPTGQRITGSLPVAEVIRQRGGAAGAGGRAARRAIRAGCPAAPATRRAARACGAASASPSAIKNICFSEGFDDYCAARVVLRADGSAVVHCAAAEVGQGVGSRAAPGRAHGARDRGRHARAAHDRHGRLGRLGLGLAHDVDGGGRRARRLPRGARRARRAPGGSEVDVERIHRHSRTTPLDPETGQVTGERAHVAFAVCAMRVVAEVDEDLGLARVVWIGAAQDVGRALNPQAVIGQIEGGTAQGLGLALMEEIQTRDGRIVNPTFTDYLLPTALDMPPLDIALIEDPEPDQPYGAKGVGEPPTVVSTAAVVAALRAASGRPLTRVPVRPDDIALG